MKYSILKISDNPYLIQSAAQWFSSKWRVPYDAYYSSMCQCVDKTDCVPQWYVVTCNDKIIAGAGVIENDFHCRKDLTPNVCAVFVEPEFRRKGIAGSLLGFICNDFAQNGVNTLYLVTDHKSFYERYEWEYYDMVENEGEDTQSRIYIHKI